MTFQRERLIQLRKERGLSQYDVCDALNLTQNQISRYETGESNPKLETLIQFAAFFGTSADYLLGLSDSRYPVAEAVDLSANEAQVVTMMRDRPEHVQRTVAEVVRAVVEGFDARREHHRKGHRMTLKLQHIDHIALTVQNVETSTQWYCDVLGMEHRYAGLWGGVPAMLFIGETGLALFPAKPDPAPPPGSDTLAVMHFAFRVDRAGFEAAQGHLTELGITFNFQDHDISHSIYFHDPDGHQLEITTYDL